MAEASEMFPRRPLGTPVLPAFDEASRFVCELPAYPDPRDVVLQRCHADPAYQRWVLGCLQVRLSIQADQTFQHPPDRRAEVSRIIRAAVETERAIPILDNQPV